MPGDLRWPVDTPPSDMLARVQGRADALRRRRRLVAAGAPIPVLMLLALLLALTLSPAGPGSNVRTGPAGNGDKERVRPNTKVGGMIGPGGQPQSGETGGGGVDAGDAPAAGSKQPGAGPPVTGPTVTTVLRTKARGGRIGFVRGGAVLSMKGDGSGVEPVTRPGVRAASLDWSPSGRQVVLDVVDPDTGASDIAVVDDDGGNFRILARDGATPRWSPDGSVISFTRQVQGAGASHSGWSVFSVRPDGTGERRLLADGQGHSWSPDSRRLVYQCHTPREVCVGAADGSSETVLQVGSGEYPSWSPDGGRIAMYQAGRLLTFNPDGGDRRFLHPEYTGRGLSWSPDGQWLASRAYRASECPAGDCGRSRILLLRASGSEVVALTSDSSDDAPVFERA